MSADIKKWFILDTLFVIVFGTLLHFVYDWSGNNDVVGIFGAINESTWEHLKLLFWPAFIFSIIEYIYIGKNFNNYVTAKCISLYLGVILIVVLFYTYTGIIGYNLLFLDIAIFIISVLISQYLGYKIINQNKDFGKSVNVISLIFIVVLAFAFIHFTFYPPEIPLFENPEK